MSGFVIPENESLCQSVADITRSISQPELFFQVLMRIFNTMIRYFLIAPVLHTTNNFIFSVWSPEKKSIH